MARDESYTVLIVPLQNSLHSTDALNCFHWLKRRKDLERQKDVLWAGLQVVEQTQLWYQDRLQLNLQKLSSVNAGDMIGKDRRSCALQSCMQRVNGSLGSLLSDSCIWNSPAPEESGASDWDLRWSNATLVKDVIQRNQQISTLELEKERLLQRLVCYSTSDRSCTTTHFHL